MIDHLISAAVEAATDNSDREWAVQRPNRGMTGQFLDSNVPAVWRGVPDRVRAVWQAMNRSRSA